MIEIRQLTKRFDGFMALDSLSLHVPRGAVYGLVGPNGAGKSTVIRHILGCYRPDAGQVLVDGRPVWENPPVKAQIAAIPDDFYFPVSATLKEMCGYYRSFYPTFDMQRFSALAAAFPEIDPRRPMRSLSKGIQKQAAFWLCISTRPRLLVLDEPVDGLDPVMRRQVWGLLLADVAENGTTVLVSSHNLRELEDVCDHVGILDHGRLLLQQNLGDLQENIYKVQLALPQGQDPAPLPEGLELLHQSTLGRVHTLIVRGAQADIRAAYGAQQPLVLDLLPLTLEEIFIYELGGKDYEVKDILL